ncbi:hypothetical protein JW796_03295 [Candidatus Dojkabacteria bacterium]|nr:hypothetical protein [Candidatus Dojkabacteria bacterium]
MIKNLFIPTKTNNYYPLLLRKGSLAIFTLILFIFNITVGSLPISKAYAAIDTSILVSLHNKERTSRGLSKLVVSSKLTNSASEKAKAMLASDCWSHYCPDKKSPWDFFKDQNYEYIYAGENLAEGFNDNEAVVQAWMNSPSHRDNMLKPEFREIGISIVQGNFQGNPNNVVVVVHFGSQVNSYNALPITSDSKHQVKEALPTNDIQNTPLIEEPENGTWTNDQFFTIRGRAKKETKVKIIDNEKNIADIDAQGGIFIYKPPSDKPFEQGNHLISSYSIDEHGVSSEKSSIVSVVVDTQAPVINTDLLEILSTENIDNYRLRILISDDTEKVYLYSNEEEKNFVRIPYSDYWEVDIARPITESSNTLAITAIDKAGNITSSTIETGNVLSTMETLSSKEIATNKLISIIAREFPSVKNVVSITALLIIVSLFVFDALLLARTNLPLGYKERGKHHLHISNFIVLLLMVLIGGAGGTIIEGLTK